MNISILYLLRVFGQPQGLASGFKPLCEAPVSVLACDVALTQQVLRSQSVKPLDIYGYYVQLMGRDVAAFPYLRAYFAHAPLTLHGAQHAQVRKGLTPLYRDYAERWAQDLGPYARDFFAARAGQSVDVIEGVEAFVSGFLAQWLALEVGESLESVLPLPFGVFSLTPRLSDLEQAEADLARWFAFFDAQGIETERAWQWMTVLLMGHEAMIATLVWGLMQTDLPSSAEVLANAAVPVNMTVGREVVEPVVFAGQAFEPGDLIYLSPFLVNLQLEDSLEPDLAFGFGAHRCLGRRMGLLVLQAFLDGHQACAPGVTWIKPALRWRRNLMLEFQREGV